MCQVIFLYQPTCQAFADSHWGEAAQVCAMRKIIQSGWRFEKAHVDSQWRESAQMRTVQQIVHSSWTSEETPADPCCSEVAQMC